MTRATNKAVGGHPPPTLMLSLVDVCASEIEILVGFIFGTIVDPFRDCDRNLYYVKAVKEPLCHASDSSFVWVDLSANVYTSTTY